MLVYLPFILFGLPFLFGAVTAFLAAIYGYYKYKKKGLSPWTGFVMGALCGGILGMIVFAVLFTAFHFLYSL